MKTITNSKSIHLTTKIMVALMAVIVLLTSFAPIKASAHSAYFLSISINESDARYEPMILYDRDGLTKTHESHRESKVAYFGRFKYWDTQLPNPSSTSSEDVEEAVKKLSDKKYSSSGIGDPWLIYTFPGYHGTGDFDASAQDMERADWIAKHLVQGLNDAISFISEETASKPNRHELMYLGTKLANGGYTSGEFTYKGKKIKVKGKANPKDFSRMRGTTNESYASIEIGDKTRYFISKLPKGYRKGTAQPLKNTVPENLKEKFEKDEHLSLTWKHVALQAHYNYKHNGTTYDTIENIVKPNKVEKMFTELGENFMLTLRNLLGLYSFSELMLNEGERAGAGYYFGIMPTAWMDSATILHFVSMAISWMLIMLAFARLLALRNLSAINVAKRVDMVDGIKNLLVVGFALMLFNPLFSTLANFNWLLVDVMKNTSNVTSQFGSSAPGAGLLSKLLINLVYLVIEVYFNFIYISRGIVVALLYGTGPLFIASLAFGGKYAQIFSNYCRELIGTIYVQTFHAILVAFFATITVFGNVRLFEQLVVLFAFIPLTKFFREAVGIGGGVADIAGAGAFGAMSDLGKSGSKALRKGSGNLASGVGKGVSSMRAKMNSAPNSNMKSSTNFQSNHAPGAGSTSMTHVDNKQANKPTTTQSNQNLSSNQTSQTSQNQSSQSPTKQQSKKDVGSMSHVDNRRRNGDDEDSFAKTTGKATAGLIGASVAVGLASTGHGSVAQNMAQMQNRPQRPPRNDEWRAQAQAKSRQNQRPPKEVFQNSAYDSSKISEDGASVTHSFTKRNANGHDGMYDDYGITDVRQSGSNMVYDYDFNADSGKFNSGTYNQGQKAMVMQDMYQAFNAPNPSPQQTATKAHYQSQGITSVKKNGNGGVEVIANNGTGGIKEVNSSNGMYHFRKRNGDNGSVNLLDSIEYSQSQDNNDKK